MCFRVFNLASSATLHILLLRHTQGDIVECGLAVWAHCFQMEMPEDWGHAQTHIGTTYRDMHCKGQEIHTSTLYFPFSPLITTSAAPLFGHFYCQITCFSYMCAAEGNSLERIFHGKHFTVIKHQKSPLCFILSPQLPGLSRNVL